MAIDTGTDTPADSVALLQQLIRFDTTNPPGNERPCVSYIAGLLRDAGVETTVLAQTPNRPNLVARLQGEGHAPPLLLYGHVDVVTTVGQKWTHPPFAVEIADGFVWGRGALDMKGGVAMMLAAFLRAKANQCRLPGDVILAILSDEEAGGDLGAKFLVERHPDLFRAVRFAIGEFGGFSLDLGSRRFYPIMVAEKQICWIKATVTGAGGHGSIPVHGQAMAKLAKLLLTLDRKSLPVHVTEPARQMFQAMASALGGFSGLMVRQVTNPWLTDLVLRCLGQRAALFVPLFHNTVSPTVLRSGNKVNVIPSEVSVELDGRLLPGFCPNDLITELRAAVGKDVAIEVLRHDPGPPAPDMGLFDTLRGVLKEADPDGVPIPLLLSGVTDARFFARLGIQTYGFLPMRLPAGFKFSETIHAADERVPLDAMSFGANAIYRVLQRFSA